ncbi:MAG: polymer-forming cytoskeletal protein [Kiloniellaceae bacterium]
MFLKDSKTTHTPSIPLACEDGHPRSSAVPSIISPDLKIVGNLKSSGDIQVDGTIEGDINSRLLIIGEGARIDGSIVADTVRVSGTVNGQVKAKSVTLDKTARVTGDVIHEDLTMEAGAFLEGGVRRMEGAGAKVSPFRPAQSGNGRETKYGEAQGTVV